MVPPASEFMVCSLLRNIRAVVGLLFGFFVTVAVQGQVTVTESFTGTSAPGWVFGGTGYTPNLTAASGIDTSGNGWLRMTDNGTQRATYALLDTQMFSVNAQIQITFDYATWNGSGADGMTFFLVDGSIDSGSFDPGSYGGSLGYAQRTGDPGMAGGYLGFALDDYGNYSSNTEGRSGGLGSGLYPNRVAVRGPESSNYAFIAASSPLQTLPGGGEMDFPTYTTRPDQTGADYRSFRLTLDANNQLTVEMKFGASGSYITAFTADLSAYDRPDTFKIGFTASTGSLTEIHEIRNTQITMTPWQDTAFEWDDGGSGSSWTTAGNWVGDVVPSTNADILFGDAPTTGATQTVTMNTDQQMRSLTFDTDMNYTIAGTGTLTLGNTSQAGLPSINVNDYNGEQAQHHINVDIDLVEDLRINNYSYSTLCLNGTLDTGGNDIYAKGTGATNFNGAIVGSGDLFKSGSGITTINNNNSSWTGDVIVNDGMVVVTTNGALGTTAGTTTVNTGGTLAFRAPTTAGSVNYTTAESVTISGQGIYRGSEGYAGAIYNDGGNNSFTGNITLAANSGIGSRDGVLTLSGQITDGASTYGLTKLGAGVVELTNASNNWNGTTTIAAGALRISNDANALAGGFATDGYTGGNLTLNGGVLEIGVGTTFTRRLGTGSDMAQFTGDGGFSAYGADRTVSLTNSAGVANGLLVWGANSFVPTGNALLLSSSEANANVTLTNAITLGTVAREIRVADGSAAVDATLSGDISSGSGGGITKTGNGTLNLTGSNNYSGATTITGGALRGNVSTISNLVLAGGVRELSGNFTGSLGTGAGNVRWTGSGGFGAVGADRTVTLNNNATTALVWGTTANFVGTGSDLILGSKSSDATLIFNNTVDLGGADRTVQVINGSAATDARMDRVISNGSLTVTGDGNLALRGANTLAGTLTVKTATVTVESTGSLNSLSSATVQDGGTLKLDNTVSASNTRFADAAAVNLHGGTLAYSGRTGAANTTETIGAINLTGGANTVDVVNNNGSYRTTLTSASLGRTAGATVNFTNSNTTNGTYSNTGNTPQMQFTAAPTLTSGVLAYATVNGSAFATVTGGYITAAASADSGWTTGNNVTYNGASTSLGGATDRDVNSVRLNRTSAMNINFNGRNLDIESGGLLVTDTGLKSFNGTGTLFSSSGELIAHIYGSGGMDIGVILSNDGANPVALTKTGDGTLTLSGATANTATGTVTVDDGMLVLNKSSGVTAIAGNIVVGDGRGTDTLRLDNNEQIADTANMTLYGSTLGGSGTLLYNGSGGVGVTETMGTLTIDGSGVIDFAGGTVCDANFLYLDDLLMNSPDSTLTIRNWIDFTDFLLVRNTSDVESVFSQIHFEGYGPGAYWESYDDNYCRVTPVPEPSTYGAIFIGTGVLAFGWRRWRQRVGSAGRS